jgi:predicted peptidase
MSNDNIQMHLIKFPALLYLVFNLTHLSLCQIPKNDDNDFEARIFKDSSGVEMPYRLFIPPNYDPSASYPIIVYLHGAKGCGNDNLKQISGGNTNGTHVWITNENQAKNPAFVVAPQLPVDSYWGIRDSVQISKYGKIAIKIVRNLLQEFSIDSDRIYLTGQSRGGYGTWDIACKYPGFFAAAVPLCGGGNPALVYAIRDLPVWAFHGEKDQTVNVEYTRVLVEALQEIDGNIIYTEYPDMDHNVWDKAYLEPELQEWLFRQKRNK